MENNFSPKPDVQQKKLDTTPPTAEATKTPDNSNLLKKLRNKTAGAALLILSAIGVPEGANAGSQSLDKTSSSAEAQRSPAMDSLRELQGKTHKWGREALETKRDFETDLEPGGLVDQMQKTRDNALGKSSSDKQAGQRNTPPETTSLRNSSGDAGLRGDPALHRLQEQAPGWKKELDDIEQTFQKDLEPGGLVDQMQKTRDNALGKSSETPQSSK
jgi:hypothetical protein